MLRSCVALLMIACGCNSLDAPGPKGGSVLVVPTDVRAAAEPLRAPPPIGGGTLAVSPDGKLAIAADPDRDRVSLIGLDTFEVRHIALTPGDEPGRVIAADGGRAYVALRRAGALAVIDLQSGALLQRVAACASPRGLALQPSAGLLHVACAEGRLVSLRVTQGALTPEPVRDVVLDADARDVLVQSGVANGGAATGAAASGAAQTDTLWVSSFKRAELLRLDADGMMLSRVAPATVTEFIPPRGGSGTIAQPVPTLALSPGAGGTPMQPHLAYRSLLDASGRVIILHQVERTAEIQLNVNDDSGQESAYGGGGRGCAGIVGPAITLHDGQGGVTTQRIASGVLSVDMAIGSRGDELVIVNAGDADPDAPRPMRVFDTEGESAFPTSSFALPASRVNGVTVTVPPGRDLSRAGQSQVSVLQVSPASGPVGCNIPPSLFVPGQATAVALRKRADGQRDDLLVQSREPALLSIVVRTSDNGSISKATVVDLGGESVRDTGHELFHRDGGSGIACASCHPEGAEDGHVWHFNTVGARRTQALHVGLEGTAPFHWNGEEHDLGHLMEDVFVGRMGGVHQSPERVSVLTRWLFSLQPPAAAAVRDPGAVQRGEALFSEPDVGCRNCHSGDKLTDNRTVDVGTGAKLQVPSLRAIAYRAPFMHDGCAAQLRDRFDPACGGKSHGNVSKLSGPQIDDLIAYLKTL